MPKRKRKKKKKSGDNYKPKGEPIIGWNESRIWAKMGLSFKQYYKGQKIGLGQQLNQQWPK